MMEETKKRPFVVNGKEYPVPEEFTLGEMCDAEQHFGVDFANPSASGARLLAATLYVAIKRVDASVTVEDIRAIDPDELMRASEVAAGPPSMPEPDESSSVSRPSSGEDSPKGGVDPDVIPIPIGQGS